jgi:cytochrome P450
VEAQANLERTLADLDTYFTEMTHHRRAHPTDDVASVIANGTVRGELISLPDAIGYYIISATAGHDTTSSTTSAGMWALAERPELLARLRAEPELIKQFIDESVRWASAVKHFMRTVSQDCEFAGQQLKKGDRVFLSYASGNRDEAVFVHPFEFDIGRKPGRHIAFGYGPHVCLGQHLASLEMRIFWEELIPRLGSVELAGAPRRVEANFVSGPKSVPIRFELIR